MTPSQQKTAVENARYIKSRELLIPFASKIADHIAGIQKSCMGTLPEETAKTWNFTFHTEMERLVREKGIVK